MDGQALPPGVAAFDEPVGGGVEVVEDVLLVGAAPGMVPRLALLQPAAQPGDGVRAAGRAPRGDLRRPHRRLGDGEPAIAVEDRRHVGPGHDVGRWIRNSPIAVPSSDSYSTWLTVRSGTTPDVAAAGADQRSAAPPSPTRHTDVGASNESTTTNAGPPERSADSPSTAMTSPSPSTVAERAAVGVVAPDACRRPGSWRPRAARRPTPAGRTATAGPSATSVVQSAGVGGTASSGTRTTRPRGASSVVTPTRASPSAANWNPRVGLDALDDRRPGPRRPLEQVDVDAGPPDLHVDEQPGAVGRQRHARPRLRVGVLGPQHRIVLPAARRAGGGGRCGGTGRPRGSGCRRSPSRRAPTPRCRPGCWGWPRRGRGRRRRRARAARSPRCRPRSCRRRRARRPPRPRTSRRRWRRRRCRPPGRRARPARRRDRRPSAG